MDYARTFLLLLSLLLNERIIKVQAFDYFALVLQWPGTVCDLDQCPNDWTIHGLWPQNDKGTYPVNCSHTEYLFDEIHLKNKDKMNEMWPSLLKRTNSTSFWAHEWTRHGTCSNLSQSAYFERALDLTANLNIKGILENKNIMPGQNQTIGNFTSAVMDRTKRRPFLTKKQKCANKHLLKEIYICYDTEFNYRDCGRKNNDLNLTIVYPEVQQQRALPFVQADDDSCQTNGHMQFRVSPAILVVLLANYFLRIYF